MKSLSGGKVANENFSGSFISPHASCSRLRKSIHSSSNPQDWKRPFKKQQVRLAFHSKWVREWRDRVLNTKTKSRSGCMCVACMRLIQPFCFFCLVPLENFFPSRWDWWIKHTIVQRISRTTNGEHFWELYLRLDESSKSTIVKQIFVPGKPF